ncbi:hypothetical protein [Methylocucumis oryzae]|uniref:Uncharacterized protein n=1 Tax=Methylocucumis oryzae TaxID=1632867 RepID=A0A0F3INC8_9GAMM|nr:hypothetical protein [Methylocucumis oryzae]KJV07049.1 hypothetical protein VZ94_07245 [Methylocucumis oryzae]
MKKLLLGAAVTAAMIGGNAQAAITVDSNGIPVINTATTYEVYLSGASAMAGFVEQLLLNSSIPAANRICDSAKLIYKFQDTATAGRDYKAYLCELNTKNSALSGLAASKPNLLLYKRDNGGSAQGVAPVIAEAAIDFLKVDTAANCTKVSDGTAGSVFTRINCTFTAGNPAFSNSKNS